MAKLGNLFASLICFCLMLFLFYVAAQLSAGVTELFGRQIDVANAPSVIPLFVGAAIVSFLAMLATMAIARASGD